MSAHKQEPSQPDEPADAAYLRRVYQAMMLAPTIEICEALLRGEHVPVELLDPEQLRRFYRRPQ